MRSPTEITVARLSRLVGLPGAPVLADVHTEEEFNSNPQLIPTAYRHASTGVEVWCRRYVGQAVVVLCQDSGTSSQAVTARLRHEGLEAQTLQGGSINPRRAGAATPAASNHSDQVLQPSRRSGGSLRRSDA